MDSAAMRMLGANFTTMAWAAQKLNDARHDLKEAVWAVTGPDETESVNVALLEALKATIGPLEYAYRNVDSVTADRVKYQILPAARALIASTP
jgi:hypothetical protein